MADDPNAAARMKAPKLKGRRSSTSRNIKWQSNTPIPSTANVTVAWAERMMLRQASFGFGSSERRNCLPGSEARKTCRLSGELTRSRSLSCAAACHRASRYWRTVLKISHATHAPAANTARIPICCLSNGSLPLPTTTLEENNGKLPRQPLRSAGPSFSRRRCVGVESREAGLIALPNLNC